VSLAAARPATAGVPVDLLDAYAKHVATLTISKAGRADRLRAAQRFLTRHPDLGVWMGRPTPQRLVDLHRAKAWPLLSWCFIAGHLRPDLELLLAKPGGVELPTTWTRRHPDDVGRVAEVGRRFGWSSNWIRQVSVLALATMGCWAGKPLDGLTEDDFAGITADLEHAAHLSVSARAHARTRLFALQQACYQLGLVGRPPRKAGPAAQSPAELVQTIRQPEIRREVIRYLTTLATTPQPASVYARAKAVMVLCDWLADHHPAVQRLDQLERTIHLEPFLAWARHRPWRGTPGEAPTAAAARSRWSSSTTTSSTCACSSTTSPAGVGHRPPAAGCCWHPTSHACPNPSHAPCLQPPTRRSWPPSPISTTSWPAPACRCSAPPGCGWVNCSTWSGTA
jgi:hypothetical protein